MTSVRPNFDPQVAALGDAIAGAAAGMFSLLVMYPLDTYKSRQQLIDKPSRRTTLPTTRAEIEAFVKHSGMSLKEAGATLDLKDLDEEELKLHRQALGSPRHALPSPRRKATDPYSLSEILRYYDGLGIGLLSDGAQQAAYYYFYELLKKKYVEYYKERPATSASLIIGSIAGTLNMIITSPLSTIHTRMQTAAMGSRSEPVTVAATFQEIVKKDGLAGLWSGLNTSLMLVINPSITFFAFESLRRQLTRFLYGKDASKTLGSVWLFMLGALAKLIATVITYPLILAKTRLQADKFGEYSGMLDVFRKILKKVGPVGFYAGMNSKLLQTCLNSAIKFMMKDAFDDLAFKILLLFFSPNA